MLCGRQGICIGGWRARSWKGQWRCVCHEKMFEIFSSKGQVIGKVSNWICLAFHIFLWLCAHRRFVGGEGLEIFQEGT